MSFSLKILSAGLIVLACLALYVGEKKVVTDDQLSLTFAEFDGIVSAPVETISAVELADYLIKQQHHYTLVDLQGSQSSYQIPTADPHSTSSFMQLELPVNQTIFLYAEHEAKALQLYYLLVIRGYFKVKILQGGAQQWKQDILQPDSDSIDPELLPHRRELTEFFGGGFNRSTQDIIPKAILLEKKIKTHHGC